MNQNQNTETATETKDSGETSSSNKVTVDLDTLKKASDETKPSAGKGNGSDPVLGPRKPSRSKKRRRPARKSAAETGEGEEQTPQPFEILDKELLKIVAGMIPFGLIASFTQQKQYELSEHEKAYLAKYWDAVIMKYLPAILDEYGEEVTLMGAIGVLLIQKSGILEVVKKSENGEAAA